MGDMMKVFVDREIDGQIREKYPHLRHPAGVCARIVKAGADSGQPGVYEYTIRILDENMNVDTQYPEIPGVVSALLLGKDEVVVVLLLYGGTDVYIIGRRYT